MSKQNETAKEVVYPEMAARFTSLLQALELNPRQFALKIESNPQNISNYVLGYALPGGNILTQIAGRWPHVNINWLLSGKGEMMSGALTLPADPAPTTPTAGPLSIVPEPDQVKDLKETIRELRRQNQLLHDILRSGGDLTKLGQVSFLLGSHNTAEQPAAMRIAS